MMSEEDTEVYSQYYIPTSNEMEMALYKVAWKLRELSNAVMESLDCEDNDVYLVLKDTCQAILYEIYNIARRYRGETEEN